MAQTPGETGLLDVVICGGPRRIDLELSGSVPMAELVPRLASAIGLLDTMTVYAGYRVVLSNGRELGPETGLGAQGVTHGDLLTITAIADEPRELVYDDVVEAMADYVDGFVGQSSPHSRRRTMTAAGLLMAASGVLLPLAYAAPLVGAGSALVAGCWCAVGRAIR